MKICKYLKKDRVCSFIAGAVAATAGVKALKSEKARTFAVKAMAKGMQFQQDAVSAFETIKEDAIDLCQEAKMRAKEKEEDK